MENNLLFFVCFALIVLNAGFGFAADSTQEVRANINQTIFVTILPSSINFGDLHTGVVDSPGPNITFDATGSNVNVLVAISSVEGILFNTGLKLNGLPFVPQLRALPCVVVDGICTYEIKSTTTSLSIPVGTPAGQHLGAIVYSISGPPPGPFV